MTPADPLAQLRDIHLPEPVSAWPPGPGWWLVTAVILILLGWATWWLLRHHRRNAWRRQAQRELEQAFSDWRDHGSDSGYQHQLSAILKRAAISQAPSGEVAGLTGERWNEYLDAHWKTPPERGFAALEFADRLYRPESNGSGVQELHELGIRWLRQLRGQTC